MSTYIYSAQPCRKKLLNGIVTLFRMIEASETIDKMFCPKHILFHIQKLHIVLSNNGQDRITDTHKSLIYAKMHVTCKMMNTHNNTHPFLVMTRKFSNQGSLNYQCKTKLIKPLHKYKYQRR